MKNLKYKLALIIGRFQPFHIGHKEIVDAALKYSDRVLILVGSAQEHGTVQNPLSYTFRTQIIKTVYQNEIRDNKLIIYPLADMGIGNNSAWGNYIINYIKDNIGCIPDVFISGIEIRRDNWFVDFENIKCIQVRKTIDISATKVREMFKMAKDDKELQNIAHFVPLSDLSILKQIKKYIDGATATNTKSV